MPIRENCQMKFGCGREVALVAYLNQLTIVNRSPWITGRTS
jgi:hypothetical protein